MFHANLNHWTQGRYLFFFLFFNFGPQLKVIKIFTRHGRSGLQAQIGGSSPSCHSIQEFHVQPLRFEYDKLTRGQRRKLSRHSCSVEIFVYPL